MSAGGRGAPLGAGPPVRLGKTRLRGTQRSTRATGRYPDGRTGAIAAIDALARAGDDAGMGTRRVVGCMTGTSIDALDAALVSIEGAGLGLRAQFMRGQTRPLGDLGTRLRRLAAQDPMPAGQIAGLARDFALLHIEVVRELLGSESADLIAVHGQTVFHAPPLSWQLFSPAPLAHALQAPVVCDLRAADLAAGGQGAPITPLADFVLFRDEAETRAVVNLGGFCNYTLLPAGRPLGGSGDLETWAGAVRGGDISACNQLLDALARALFAAPFDEDGRHARAGRMQSGPRYELLTLLRAQSQAGRALGTGDELSAWIAQHRDACSGDDLARTACEAVATVIVESIAAVAQHSGVGPVRRYLLAGGGARNPVLREALAARAATASGGPGARPRATPSSGAAGAPVVVTDAFGVPANYREAAAMAVLGALCQDGVPITLPQVTGVPAPAPVAGVWVYPERGAVIDCDRQPGQAHSGERHAPHR